MAGVEDMPGLQQLAGKGPVVRLSSIASSDLGAVLPPPCLTLFFVVQPVCIPPRDARVCPCDQGPGAHWGRG